MAYLFRGAEQFTKLLVDGIMRNISVKLIPIWTSGAGDVIQRHFLSRSQAVPLCSGEEMFMPFR